MKEFKIVTCTYWNFFTMTTIRDMVFASTKQKQPVSDFNAPNLQLCLFHNDDILSAVKRGYRQNA